MMSRLLIVVFGLTLATLAMSVPLSLRSPLTSEQVIDDTPRPYEFGYEFGDGQGMNQHRRESSDGAGKVKGSYSYTDPFGVYRNVEYQADADGYRAVIKSNEPGLSNQNAADTTFIVEPPPPGAILQQSLPSEVVEKAVKK
ncbi:cuticle protein 16.8 [Trichonephila clavata]|uniref:Cuticle protein 16.8 n=1 Tax=Trichonephila clavata TaxID=2740835 RepID=A0A8X6JK85_TRICU|nr:cuticle protein 16.8 [Trichonephila clavata]